MELPAPVRDGSVFNQFWPVLEDKVLEYIQESNKTNCPLDPINVSKLGPPYLGAASFITHMINVVFVEGSFLTSEKGALVRPYLKRTDLGREDLSSYPPVSNLSYLSKIVERAILDQLLPILEHLEVISRYQSAYRKFHSTETALCKIHNDLVNNVCLDLSTAYDATDHRLLLSNLVGYGVEGSAFGLLESYLPGRTQSVIVGKVVSQTVPLMFGVPQGLVLGSLLFIVYTSSLVLLEAHGVGYHFYTNDTQLYICIDDIEDAKDKIVILLGDIRKWMLNDGKTEVT